MPVLSPHRSSASGLSGSYRSSAPLYTPRIYTDPSVYMPKIYSERYTSRTFIDSNGKRVFSRSASITEDGVTTRFREESREGSLRRDSMSRDSGISSIRENSVLDYPRRDSSLGRSDRLSTSSVIDSVAELRNKYSPANYVPAIYRNKYENISRSKSINDIGLPPLEKSMSPSAASAPASRKKQCVSACSSNTNRDGGGDADADDDENQRRTSVADLRRKFDDMRAQLAAPPPSKRPPDGGGDLKGGKEAVVNGALDASRIEDADADVTRRCLQPKTADAVNGDDKAVDGAEPGRRSAARVNQCASYIPSSNNDGEAEAETGAAAKSTRDLTASSGARGGGRAAPSPGLPLRFTRGATDEDGGVSPDPRGAAASIATLGLVGLKNIGNTCFMNSVIQCLSNTRPLLEYVRHEDYLHDVNRTTSSMKGALIQAFAEVIRGLWSGGGLPAINTAALKSQIQRFAPRFMGYAQQDAQEFLRYLLEGLHEDVNKVTTKPRPPQKDIDDSLPDAEKAAEAWKRYLRVDNSFIVDVFVGQLKSTLKCTHCGHCSVTFDPFWDLSLPLPSSRPAGNTIRLSHCLDTFAEEETLDGDEKPTCARCKERRKCTKSFAIQKFPQTLVIHLKRFSPMERFRGKLNTLVEFPLEGLDLSSYAAEPHHAPPPRYTLYAVSNHSGTSCSGHYTAYCRHPYDQRWHEYNDSRVTAASTRFVVSPEAYVLFYEREGGGAPRSRL
ncbi:ubiquitin carboxyl-terminal hydrolase 2-like isoform X2 [Cylas formicarius]|uniref:ubiquitin carboxyl-terminal hydrolase 2-like isoform X2 n=1 Tax=Cylas formicarius TaxID=197179 RepID=UPI002958AFDB|nr:ubiquitin carboxyl-terminal hydrolase 2-like isoform X2 [Cylas formicarius]